MELVSVLVIIIVLVYVTKNAKGKQVVEHLGNTAVNLAASADDASAALHKQCHELLMSNEEAEAAKAKAKAKIAKASKAKTVDNYDDAE
jgi:hypothetical protein